MSAMDYVDMYGDREVLGGWGHMYSGDDEYHDSEIEDEGEEEDLCCKII